MLNNRESIDMVSLLSYSVHAAQGYVWLGFAKFSVYERLKMIQSIVMLSVRLYSLKGAFLKRFFFLNKLFFSRLKIYLLHATSPARPQPKSA